MPWNSSKVNLCLILPTNENNNKPCNINEVAKVKIPKKKLHMKNMMPGIPEVEEPYNDEMDIKQQNQKPPN